MNVVPEQTKVEQGGTYAAGGKAEIHDRAGLFAGIIGFGVAMLSLGIALWAISQARDLRTEVLLLREDIRQMTIDQAKDN